MSRAFLDLVQEEIAILQAKHPVLADALSRAQAVLLEGRLFVEEDGHTATVLGRTRAIASLRGKVLGSAFGPPMVATVHPSSIVRVPDRDDRRAALQGLVHDLRSALELE